MINKITIVPSYGEAKTMTLREPWESGYAILGISGIEPSDVDIKLTQFVSGRKYKYNAGFHKYRLITLNIKYYEENQSGKTIKKLRDELYQLLKTNDLVKLYIYNDNYKISQGEIYYIEGVVDKHQGATFSQSCDASISITCPDPWFRKMHRFDDTGSYDVDNLTYDNEKLLSSSPYSTQINYLGHINTGFKIEINNDTNDYRGNELKIETTFNSKTRTMILNIPSEISGSNKLIIDIGEDIVDIYEKSNDTEIDRIGWLDITSVSKRQELPSLYPGNDNNQNTITITSNGDFGGAKIIYPELYGGI